MPGRISADSGARTRTTSSAGHVTACKALEMNQTGVETRRGIGSPARCAKLLPANSASTTRKTATATAATAASGSPASSSATCQAERAARAAPATRTVQVVASRPAGRARRVARDRAPGTPCASSSPTLGGGTANRTTSIADAPATTSTAMTSRLNAILMTPTFAGRCNGSVDGIYSEVLPGSWG